ncbi:hypothetical protein C4565_01055 [Candidatus Parcubacteria bacterium]|jgi:plastocyanin|nr:MAG: hypothetical protein C4565_01055 [Candidatus Parcubacteria bacterium]
MQSVIRFIITLLFIGLIVIGVVFFSIIAVVPKDKLEKIKNKDYSSTQTTGKKSILDISLFAPIRAFIDEVSQGNNSTPAYVPPSNSGEIETYPAELPQPQASVPLPKGSIPSGVEKIIISESGFKPSIFRVKEGEQVVLILENQGRKTHSFAFKDQLFAPVNISLGPGESRGIQFYAIKKGEFVFRCDLPGHEDAGEVGTMIIE